MLKSFIVIGFILLRFLLLELFVDMLKILDFNCLIKDCFMWGVIVLFNMYVVFICVLW